MINTLFVWSVRFQEIAWYLDKSLGQTENVLERVWLAKLLLNKRAKQFSHIMVNDLAAYVELEHDIVRWSSQNVNSLVFIYNTAQNKTKWCWQTENGLVLEELRQSSN